MITWDKRFESVRHGKFLREFFELFFVDPENITEDDKQEYIIFIQDKLSCSLEKLGEQVQTGLDDGYSPDSLLLIIHAFLKQEGSVTENEKWKIDKEPSF
jgi:hypothetical protein